jgi:hypothetical protein
MQQPPRQGKEKKEKKKKTFIVAGKIVAGECQ